jgi:hypothetical protein
VNIDWFTIGSFVVSIAAAIAAIAVIPKDQMAFIVLCWVLVAAGLGAGGYKLYVNRAPELTMTTPTSGSKYQGPGNIAVDLEGHVRDDDAVWVGAQDSNQYWYPLAQAEKNHDGAWSATIHGEQVMGSISLCALALNKEGAQQFESYLQSSSVSEGLATLPSGSVKLDCNNIEHS